MYKRKLNQVSLFENPAMFGGIALDPKNEWVKLAGMIPWWVFEKKYAEQFPSGTGQPACSLRMALGSQLIKERYRFSDEMTVEHIAMNPYLQYFIGMTEYRQTAPFDPSMMSRFRQRLTPEMMQDVNDVIIGRKTAEQIANESENHDDDSGDNSPGGGGDVCQEPEEEEAPNEGTLILDATCAAGDSFPDRYLAFERSAAKHRRDHRFPSRCRPHGRQETQNVPRHSEEAIQRIFQESQEDRQEH